MFTSRPIHKLIEYRISAAKYYNRKFTKKCLITFVQQLAYSQTDRVFESGSSGSLFEQTNCLGLYNIYNIILKLNIYQKMVNNICLTVGRFTNRSNIWIGVLGLYFWAWSRTLLTCTPWRSCPTFWRNWTRRRSSRSRSTKLTS